MSGWAIAAQVAAEVGGAERKSWQDRQTAKRQMQFQENMSNTSHQREVADLLAAGLNPVLSANGGASTPGGAGFSAVAPDIPKAVNSALATERLDQELNNMKAGEDATKAQESLTKMQEAVASTQFNLNQAHTAKMQAETANLNEQNEILRAAAAQAQNDEAFYNSPIGEKLRWLNRFSEALSGSANTATKLKELGSKGKK